MDKKYFSFLVDILKNHFRQEIWGLIFTFVYTFSILFAPFVSKYLLDNILIVKNFNELPLWLLLFFISCLLQPISGYIKNYIFFNISEKITFSIRRDVLFNIMLAPMSFLDKTSKGTVISRVLNDCQNISEFISNIFIVVIKNTILLSFASVTMFILSWQISLLVIVLLGFYMISTFYLSKKVEKISKKKLTENDVLCKSINECLTNLSLIRTSNLTEFWSNKNLKILKKIYNNNLYLNKFKNLFETLSNIIIVISISIIYSLGSILVLNNAMSLGTIFAISLYFQVLVQPVYELINNTIQFRDVAPSLKRLNEYLSPEKEPKNIKLTNPNPTCTAQNSLLINDLSFNYKKDDKKICALKNINIKFEGSGVYGIVGSSGSGKSTLIKLILGLYPWDSGQIEVTANSKRICDISDIRDSVSYVSQDLELLNASILENLKLFNENITTESVISICKKLNLDSTINQLPLGYDDILNEKVNLSGGEKQRICVARAILKNSPIYIFDEPTSSLDVASENIVCSMISELAKNSLVVFITHNISLLKRAKNIVVLDKGQVIYSGGYKNLSNNISRGNFSKVLASK